MKVAIIPARGGSKRIPRKNIRPFFGKPILWYSIEAAKRSGLFNAIHVSTEDPEIATIALNYGVGVIPRPLNLAEMNGSPDCGTQEVARHALVYLYLQERFPTGPIDYVCTIYPTAPMMTASELAVGLKAVKQEDAAHAFAVGENPLRDAGQWYWSKAWALLARTPLTLAGADSYKIVIPEERVCDINTEEDWARAEAMYRVLHRLPTSSNQHALGEAS